MYQLVAINKKTGNRYPLGKPDTLKRVAKYRWSHIGGISQQYNNYVIERVTP